MTSATMHATGTFEVTGWDEKPVAEVAGAPKVTHAVITSAYAGDVEGQGTTEWLMFYPTEATATYTGFERVVGRLGGRSGSFVLRAEGTYENGVAATIWSVMPGSGTEELAGLRGDGRVVARHGETKIAYELDYRFE